MLLLLHILIALSSIVCTTYLLLRPSRRKLTVSYGLVGLTLLSGTALVVSSHVGLAHACLTGSVYVIVVVSGNLVARHKLATASA